MRRVAAVFTLVLGSSAATACDEQGGTIGSPCEQASDCNGDLICDVHDGQGSCQEPHGHSGSDSDSDSDSSDAGSESDSSSSGSDTSEPASTTSDGSGSTSGDPQTTTATTGGMLSPCEMLCDCLELNCAEQEEYPFSDTTTCLDWCEQQPAQNLECHLGYCEEASIAIDPLHSCEHAWGDLGDHTC